jgi:hypothetical protein
LPKQEPTRKPGRPKVEIDLELLESLAHDGCTNEEIAAFFGITERALEIRFAKEAALRQAKLRGLLKGNVSLRQRQMEMALKGHGKEAATMLIWLGKQKLGQKDKLETDSKIAAQVQVTKIERVIVDPQNPDT